MRILVVTSCTGEKTVETPNALTQADFAAGPEHVAHREASLPLTPAEELYAGLQHIRLMDGIRAVRTCPESGWTVDLHIVSAGYGLVPAARSLAPYEMTFTGMKSEDLRGWAMRLRIPADIRALLAEPYDLGLVLLGDHYLQACQLDASMKLGGPTLLFCGLGPAKKLPVLKSLRVVTLSNAEATRYQCGLVGLKGEVAKRILHGLLTEPDLAGRLSDVGVEVLSILDQLAARVTASPTPTSAPLPKGSAKPRGQARAHPNVDRVITLPDSWRHKPHRARLRYFIPEWDDLVDPDYDFETDTHSGGSGDWSNEVYAHQMYPEPNYDGILVSKVVAEKSKKKKDRINAWGVHRFLRVPRDFPIMGDCGAFGYIMEDNPPYTTDEILDYYTRLDFDYGVSVDHLIVSATEAQKQHRYQLTIDNAEQFLREHRQRGLSWTPIGAVQGWDPKSYAKAARQYVAMGYNYIALGGLVRTSTAEIVRVLEEVHAVVPASVNMHLFGVARLSGLRDFASHGVTSVDSASYLRRAWLGAGQNYLTDRGEFVAAIRIPVAEKSFRAKRMVSEGRASLDQVQRMEQACFQAMHDYDAGRITVRQACDILEEYDQLITSDRKNTRPLLEKALEDAPWKRCPCAICQRDGIQVIIFGGNNRNRRRGFHNTWQFYRILQELLAGKDVPIPDRKSLATLLVATRQGSLFGDDDEED